MAGKCAMTGETKVKHPKRRAGRFDNQPPHVPKLMYGDVLIENTGEAKRIAKNKDIILKGKSYKSLFINHDGWLFRYKTLRDGGRQILDFILPGQIFGLQARLF